MIASSRHGPSGERLIQSSNGSTKPRASAVRRAPGRGPRDRRLPALASRRPTQLVGQAIDGLEHHAVDQRQAHLERRSPCGVGVATRRSPRRGAVRAPPRRPPGCVRDLGLHRARKRRARPCCVPAVRRVARAGTRRPEQRVGQLVEGRQVVAGGRDVGRFAQRVCGAASATPPASTRATRAASCRHACGTALFGAPRTAMSAGH